MPAFRRVFKKYDRLNESLKAKGIKPIDPKLPEVDENGYASMQLWSFMQLFGEHMRMGGPEVIEPLELIYNLEEKDV